MEFKLSFTDGQAVAGEAVLAAACSMVVTSIVCFNLCAPQKVSVEGKTFYTLAVKGATYTMVKHPEVVEQDR